MATRPPSTGGGAAPVGQGADAGTGGGPAITVDFRVLGPLEIRVDGTAHPMPGGKPKALLAILLINRNHVVSSDAIADAIWDGDSPPSYLGILQVYMSTLRRSLRAAAADGQAVITTQAPGYRLSIDDACVDLGRFTRWVTVGNELLREQRYAEASARFRAALAEWSGPALADLRGLRFADDFAVAVEEERLLALQARIDADLACGMDSAVIGELTTLTGQHPLREPFWIQRITALYRLGRQADALEASRRIRELLNDELGIDPSPPLRELERKILRQESLSGVPAQQLLTSQPSASRPAAPQPPVQPSPAAQPTVSETAVVLSSARLVLSSGDSVPIPARGLRIGRMDDNDLVIEGVKVSRYHAVVVEMAGGFAVNDLRSTNGTLVDGERVLDSHLLHAGDVIRIGGTELRFELDG